jgi:hypothetical protein
VAQPKEWLERFQPVDLQECKPRAAIVRLKGLKVAYFEALKLPPREAPPMIDALYAIIPEGLGWGRNVHKGRP